MKMSLLCAWKPWWLGFGQIPGILPVFESAVFLSKLQCWLTVSCIKEGREGGGGGGEHNHKTRYFKNTLQTSQPGQSYSGKVMLLNSHLPIDGEREVQ